MRIYIIIAMVLLSIIAGLYGYGNFLPERRTVAVEAVLPRTAEDVWPFIADYERLPVWYTPVTSVEQVGEGEGVSVWRVQLDDGHSAEVEIVQANEPTLHISRMSASDLPHGINRTVDLAPMPVVSNQPPSVRLRVSDELITPDPWRRLQLQLLDSPDMFARRYLTELAGQLQVQALDVQVTEPFIAPIVEHSDTLLEGTSFDANAADTADTEADAVHAEDPASENVHEDTSEKSGNTNSAPSDAKE